MGVESRITEVTLYARGARVRREVTAALSGPRLRITGLPGALLDDTVRVEASGAVVSALHVGLDAPPPSEAAAEDSEAVTGLRRRVALASAEVDRLLAALAALESAPVVQSRQPEEAPPPWAAVVAARHQLIGLHAGRELALRDQAAAADRALTEARDALTAELDRDRRAGTARAPKLHELRKHVELEVAGTGPGTVTLVLEYQVAAARWAPSYVARLDGDAVRVELRAVVAQATGEDWTGVAVRLSTAEPERFDPLPELHAQRLGRRQAEPVRPGFRAAPAGAGELYLDYVRAFPDGFDDAPTSQAPALDAAWDDADSPFAAGEVTQVGAGPARMQSVPERARARMAPMAAAMPPPPPAAFPQTMPMPVMSPGGPPMARKSASLFGAAASAVAGIAQGYGARGGGGAPELDEGAPWPAPPPPAPRLDYGNLRMMPPSARNRGTLVPAPADPRTRPLDSAVAAAVARIHVLTLPSGCRTDWPHTYAYAFAGDGTVDVRADGSWHSIAVAARAGTAVVRHVAVPREQADVFRVAEIANPFDGPLLPGPIDVYDRGTFLVTSTVAQTPPGATVELGLGVDAQIKLARNTEFSEEATGMLRGALRLHHAIAIDIDNHADRAIDLEVRERIPVAREGDDDVEVVLGKVEPAWERWTPDPEAPRERRLRGGYRWKLAIPAHGKRTLRAAYDVKIANKLELVGGNRRES